MTSLVFPEDGKNTGRCGTWPLSFGLCIAAICSNRSRHLRLVMARLVEFITKAEPNLSYELFWIGQSNVDRTSFGRLYRFERKFVFAKPVGYSSFLRLAFSQCIREYIFILKDDWLATNTSLPWFSFSMDLLAHGEEPMYAILLPMASINGLIHRTIARSCLVPSGTVWTVDDRTFHFASGPAVYRMSSIRTILKEYDYINKYGFGAVAKRLGYTLSFWADGIAPPSQVPIRFQQLAVGSTN
jgi:hypothetical protein